MGCAPKAVNLFAVFAGAGKSLGVEWAVNSLPGQSRCGNQGQGASCAWNGHLSKRFGATELGGKRRKGGIERRGAAKCTFELDAASL